MLGCKFRLAAVVLGIASICGCRGEKSGSSAAEGKTAASVNSTAASLKTPSASSSAANAPAPAKVEPTALLRLPVSAYHPVLSLADDAAYLLTATAAYRLAPEKPPERFELDLGIGPALTRSAFVFWSKGAVRRVPKGGGPSVRVCNYAHQPQFFVSANDHFAWIDRAEDGAFTIQVPDEGRARALVSPPGQIAAAAMIDDWVFFAEAANSAWRINAAHEPGKVTHGPLHQGRPPSMLTVDADSLFYFDIDRLEIVKVSPDLQREESWVKGVICSPIAVAGAAYCGNVEGLLSVSNTNPKPSLLVGNARSLVTSVVADATRVVWIRDVGPDQLLVESLPLSTR